MHKVKILHIGDVHFDRKITHLNSHKADIRRSETLLTFKKCLEQFSDAQIVLVSGDLFDGEYNPDTVNFVTDIFRKNSHMKFFLVSGNHDSYFSRSTSELLKAIPDNVTYFGDAIDRVCLEEYGVCVYGVSFTEAYSYSSLLSGFRCEDDNCINIMVMHGDTGNDIRYNAISKNEIAQSRVDYLALGHIHKFSGFNRCDNTTYAYPGIIEPCGFDETGLCGVIYGEIAKNNVNLDFYPVSRRQYHTIELDVSAYKSQTEIISALSDMICADDFYKIVLKGRKSYGINTDVICEVLPSFYMETENLTLINDTILNYQNELSLRGKTADYLELMKGECSDEVYKVACEIATDYMCKGD